MASPLDSTYGMWLVFLFIMAILYGVGLLQAFLYSRWCALIVLLSFAGRLTVLLRHRNDPRWVQALVRFPLSIRVSAPTDDGRRSWSLCERKVALSAERETDSWTVSWKPCK